MSEASSINTANTANSGASRPPARRISFGFVVTILLLLMVALAVVALQRGAFHLTSRPANPAENAPEIQALQDTITAQQVQLRALENRVNGLEQSGARGDGAASSALTERIHALEIALGQMANERQDRDSVKRIESALAQTQWELKQQKQAANEEKYRTRLTIEQLLALHRLIDAINTGRGFEDELTRYRRLLASATPQAVEALEDFAKTGLPTEEQLIAKFPALSREALLPTLPDAESSWWDRLRYNLATLITVRRVTPENDGTGTVENRLAEAESFLASRDWKEAADTVRDLPESEREVFAEWLEQVDMRTHLPSVIDQLYGINSAPAGAANEAKEVEPKAIEQKSTPPDTGVTAPSDTPSNTSSSTPSSTPPAE